MHFKALGGMPARFHNWLDKWSWRNWIVYTRLIDWLQLPSGWWIWWISNLFCQVKLCGKICGFSDGWEVFLCRNIELNRLLKMCLRRETICGQTNDFSRSNIIHEGLDFLWIYWGFLEVIRRIPENYWIEYFSWLFFTHNNKSKQQLFP